MGQDHTTRRRGERMVALVMVSSAQQSCLVRLWTMEVSAASVSTYHLALEAVEEKSHVE